MQERSGRSSLCQFSLSPAGQSSLCTNNIKGETKQLIVKTVAVIEKYRVTRSWRSWPPKIFNRSNSGSAYKFGRAHYL